MKIKRHLALRHGQRLDCPKPFSSDTFNNAHILAAVGMDAARQRVEAKEDAYAQHGPVRIICQNGRFVNQEAR